MEANRPAKRLGKNAHFWRACRYLWPYRAQVALSIVCAFFVGLTYTGGLGGLLPILRVVTSGDTVQGWAYGQIAEQRLGLRFLENPGIVRVGQIDKEGPAAAAGIQPGDVVQDVPAPVNAPPSPFPGGDPAYRVDEILRRFAWADGTPITVTTVRSAVQLTPKTSHTFAAQKLGLNFVQKLPIQPVPAVAVVFGILATIAITGQAIRFFQEYLSDAVGIHAVNDLRRRLYDRVLRVPMQYFGQQGTSDVTSRLVSDSGTLQDGFKQVLGQTIQEPIKVAMFLSLSLWLSWQLTLFMLIFAPIMLIIVRKFGKKMRRASRAALQKSSIMLGQIESTLMGVRVVKASNAERYERRRYSKIMATLIQEQLRMSRTDAMSAPVLETAIMLMAGCVVLMATHLIVIGSIKSNVFFGVMLALFVIADSLRKVSKASNALQKANAAAGRIFEAIDMPVEREHRPQNLPGAEPAPILKKLPPLQSAIVFENVSFTYPNCNTLALDGVNLYVPRGQSLAIVGRNGSGKTTLVSLLERFYDPQQGTIYIDKLDLRTVTRTSLRRQISIVTQDSVIFPGTIAQNIAYGNPTAAPDAMDSPARKMLLEQIEDAARRAFAHDFIMEKPLGYHTMLEGIGSQLSGGQKQRLCIARAILRKAPILILDEATSQVDAESEHLIQEATEHLMHERTTFVIAHRFSTIISADTIVVMERGQIVGQGKHDELLVTCPIYQQLYDRQLFATAAK